MARKKGDKPKVEETGTEKQAEPKKQPIKLRIDIEDYITRFMTFKYTGQHPVTTPLDIRLSSPPGVNFTFEHTTDPSIFQTTVTLTAAREWPIEMIVQLSGQFSIWSEDGNKEPPFTRGMASQSVAILYGIARGLIGTMAGWSGIHLSLPAIYPDDEMNRLYPIPKPDHISNLLNSIWSDVMSIEKLYD